MDHIWSFWSYFLGFQHDLNMISTVLQLLPRHISSLHCSHLLFGHCRWGGRRDGCGSRRSDNVAHVHQDAVACGPDGALAKLAKLVRAKHLDGVYGRYICLYFIGFVSLVYVCTYVRMYTYIHMYICTSVRLYVCTCVRVYGGYTTLDIFPISCCFFSKYVLYLYIYNIDPGKPAAEVSQT